MKIKLLLFIFLLVAVLSAFISCSYTEQKPVSYVEQETVYTEENYSILLQLHHDSNTLTGYVDEVIKIYNSSSEPGFNEMAKDSVNTINDIKELSEQICSFVKTNAAVLNELGVNVDVPSLEECYTDMIDSLTEWQAEAQSTTGMNAFYTMYSSNMRSIISYDKQLIDICIDTEGINTALNNFEANKNNA